MKARTKFLKMYYKLPTKARVELVKDFSFNPVALSVIATEVIGKTKLGDKHIKELGYEDDAP
jgi:hypothetical protein